MPTLNPNLLIVEDMPIVVNDKRIATILSSPHVPFAPICFTLAFLNMFWIHVIHVRGVKGVM
jgi:hypothetical protein